MAELLSHHGTVCFSLFISFREVMQRQYRMFLCSGCSWIDLPLFYDFLTLQLHVPHTARLFTSKISTSTTFLNHLKVNSPITYSLLYISFPSLIGKKFLQSAAIDITQHARINHIRQQREKFKTKIN